MGEATSQITIALKIKYDGLDWVDMVRARNYYVHE